MTDREIAHEIIGKLLDADVEAFERTITDAENTVYRVLQQVKSVDLADVVGMYPTDRDTDRYFENRVNEEGVGKTLARHYFDEGIKYLKLAIEETFE